MEHRIHFIDPIILSLSTCNLEHPQLMTKNVSFFRERGTMLMLTSSRLVLEMKFQRQSFWLSLDTMLAEIYTQIALASF